MTTKFIIGNKSFRSRLLIGTGKYRSYDHAKKSVDASNAEIVTIAVRRLSSNYTKLIGNETLLKYLDWNKMWMLPNTAGARTSDEALRLGNIGLQLSQLVGQENNKFIKLEVIADNNYLMPDPLGTIKAADYFIKRGCTVMPYISPDPHLAKHLEEMGCATVMPLGSPIGSQQGINSEENLQMIIENAKIPVIVDAGLGKASDACQAIELGASAVLINTAIAEAKDPEKMADAMRVAVEAGYLASLTKRRDEALKKASRSSPEEGLFL